MRFKEVGGTIIGYNPELGSPQGVQFFKGLQKYLPYLLGAALVALCWAWSTQISAAQFTLQDMRDYAVIQINQAH